MTASAEMLCQSWGEECTPEENARIAELWKMAFGAPFVVVGLWGLFDLVVLARSSRPVDPEWSDDWS